MQPLKIGAGFCAALLCATEITIAGPVNAPPPPPGTIHTGRQWITTPDGCSYTHTQAPGYPVQWILIQNPHHIGQPDVHSDCLPVLSG